LDNTHALASFLGWHFDPKPLSIILPIGLSFHTFQSLAYVIEVYHKRYRAEQHMGVYAVYVLFYPQLVAGPIERPAHLLPQLKKNIAFFYDNLVAGLRLMLWGFFKKMVVADRLSLIVDDVYSCPQSWDGVSLIMATFLFAFQIYCDFSGYTDIARGSAKAMGIDLMQNFKRPYIALNISEFWHRWHISLSTWFRDYVYIPLGGNKQGGIWFCRNIMITFILSGLWHGANWTFLIWGALNGFYLLIQRFWQNTPFVRECSCAFTKVCPLLAHLSSWALTFVAINLTWVFFRAEDLSAALTILGRLGALEGISLLSVDPRNLGITLTSVGMLLLFERVFGNKEFHQWIETHPQWRRWVFYYLLVLALLFIGVFEQRQFIYFQF
jgi:alginate O-acetyltransferase complex protein AlgI